MRGGAERDKVRIGTSDSSATIVQEGTKTLGDLNLISNVTE